MANSSRNMLECTGIEHRDPGHQSAVVSTSLVGLRLPSAVTCAESIEGSKNASGANAPCPLASLLLQYVVRVPHPLSHTLNSAAPPSSVVLFATTSPAKDHASLLTAVKHEMPDDTQHAQKARSPTFAETLTLSTRCDREEKKGVLEDTHTHSGACMHNCKERQRHGRDAPRKGRSSAQRRQ